MHDIEPHYNWRDRYIASEDKRSPFYGRIYDEFRFTKKIYNYFIHPQWDEFGSPTLYLKIIFVDYDEGFAIIELIGEWNDCLTNDVMFLKRDIADHLMDSGVYKFILICENVLNFHGSDDCYYEEWYEDVKDKGGWVCLVNTLDHVFQEMEETRLHFYLHLGTEFNNINWRPQRPKIICKTINALVEGEMKLLP